MTPEKRITAPFPDDTSGGKAENYDPEAIARQSLERLQPLLESVISDKSDRNQTARSGFVLANRRAILHGGLLATLGGGTLGLSSVSLAKLMGERTSVTPLAAPSSELKAISPLPEVAEYHDSESDFQYDFHHPLELSVKDGDLASLHPPFEVPPESPVADPSVQVVSVPYPGERPEINSKNYIPRRQLFAPSAAVPKSYLRLFDKHRKDSLHVAYKVGGEFDRAALKKLNWFMRDRLNNKVARIDPALFDLLFRITERLGREGATIEVVSGYRSPSTNAYLKRKSRGVAENSYHMKGMAIDFKLERTPLSRLHIAALSLSKGGVGYYPSSDFVHVDTGPVRAWPNRYRHLALKYQKKKATS